MTFVFTEAALAIANGSYGDLDAIDLRAALLMNGNNAVASRATAINVSDLTLDEFDGANYARQALGSEALAKDAGNFRIELTAAATVWSSLGAGTKDVAGALLYRHVTNDTDSTVLAYYDDGGFPKPGTGSDFTVTWSAEGLLQLTTPLT